MNVNMNERAHVFTNIWGQSEARTQGGVADLKPLSQGGVRGGTCRSTVKPPVSRHARAAAARASAAGRGRPRVGATCAACCRRRGRRVRAAPARGGRSAPRRAARPPDRAPEQAAPSRGGRVASLAHAPNFGRLRSHVWPAGRLRSPRAPLERRSLSFRLNYRPKDSHM